MTLTPACVLLAIAGALIVATSVALRRLRPWHLAPQGTRDAESFRAIVEQWAEAGTLERYRAWLWVDFATLACYGLGGFLLARDLAAPGPLGALPSLAQLLAPLLMPLAAGADTLENLLHLQLTSLQRAQAPTAAYAWARAATRIKFALIFAYLAALVWTCAAALAAR